MRHIRFWVRSSPRGVRPSPLSRRPAMPVKMKIWGHTDHELAGCHGLADGKSIARPARGHALLPAPPADLDGRHSHLVILSVRRSRIRDGGEWAEVAVQRPDPASPSWRDRLADRDDAASSAAGYAAEVRCSSC